MKKFTKTMIRRYFDIDVDNCLMSQADFCDEITKILNNPIESRIRYEKEIKEYYLECGYNGDWERLSNYEVEHNQSSKKGGAK